MEHSLPYSSVKLPLTHPRTSATAPQHRKCLRMVALLKPRKGGFVWGKPTLGTPAPTPPEKNVDSKPRWMTLPLSPALLAVLQIHTFCV